MYSLVVPRKLCVLYVNRAVVPRYTATFWPRCLQRALRSLNFVSLYKRSWVEKCRDSSLSCTFLFWNVSLNLWVSVPWAYKKADFDRDVSRACLIVEFFRVAVSSLHTLSHRAEQRQRVCEMKRRWLWLGTISPLLAWLCVQTWEIQPKTSRMFVNTLKCIRAFEKCDSRTCLALYSLMY